MTLDCSTSQLKNTTLPVASYFLNIQGAARQHAHHNFLDVVRLEFVRLDQLRQRIERRLNRSARGPALDVGVDDFEGFAEPPFELLRPRCGGERDKKIAVPREYVVDGAHAKRHHGRGSGPVARRHAAKHKRFFDVLGIARIVRQPGSLITHIRKQMARLIGIETGE